MVNTMTDFRTLCAELVELDQAEPGDYADWRQSWNAAIARARAALAQPKPPSLKEQAIAELDDAVMRGDCITVSEALPTIRRALEALPDD
jgi:hypothetical protein